MHINIVQFIYFLVMWDHLAHSEFENNVPLKRCARKEVMGEAGRIDGRVVAVVVLFFTSMVKI